MKDANAVLNTLAPDIIVSDKARNKQSESDR